MTRETVINLLIGLAGILAAVLVLNWIGLIGIDPDDADVKADWIGAREAVFGVNAHADIAVLAARHDVEYRYRQPQDADTASHPRTPGALLLLAPILLIPFGALHQVALWLSFFSIYLLAVLVWRQVRYPQRWLALFLPVMAVALPALWTYRYASHTALIAVLITLVYVGTHERDRRYAGAALAAAGVLKLFPLLLLVPLATARRWNSVRATGIAFLALSLAGLALPGVLFSSAVDSIANASSVWFEFGFNVSLGRLLHTLGLDPVPAVAAAAAIGLSALALFQVAARSWDIRPAERITVTLAVALLVSPITWPSYLVLLYPAFLWHLKEFGQSGPATVMYWTGAILILLPHLIPSLYTAGIAALALAVATSAYRRTSEGRRRAPDVDQTRPTAVA